MPRISTPVPNARNHPQYWTISWGIWTCTWTSPRFIFTSSFQGRSPLAAALHSSNHFFEIRLTVATFAIARSISTMQFSGAITA